MKNIFFKIFLFFLSLTIFSDSEIEFSINSDSIWRGLTQNNGNPTVGADINFSLDSYTNDFSIKKYNPTILKINPKPCVK